VSSGEAPSVRTIIQNRIVGRALADSGFRDRLLANPRAAVAEELAVVLPAELEIVVVEESPSRLAIVLPVDLDGLGPDAVWAMTGTRPG
jgi:hypothetical protein